jgi:hypothetical protein
LPDTWLKTPPSFDSGDLVADPWTVSLSMNAWGAQARPNYRSTDPFATPHEPHRGFFKARTAQCCGFDPCVRPSANGPPQTGHTRDSAYESPQRNTRTLATKPLEYRDPLPKPDVTRRPRGANTTAHLAIESPRESRRLFHLNPTTMAGFACS